MKYIFTLVSICICLLSAKAQQQNVEFKKKNFPEQSKEFRKAKSNLQKGYKLYEDPRVPKEEALPFLLKAQAFNSNNAVLNYRIGVCYVNTNQKQLALEFLNKATGLNPEIANDVWFHIGYAYHSNTEFEKAIEAYTKFRKQPNFDENVKIDGLINRKLRECENGVILMKDTARAIITNLSKTVNSNDYDYAPVVNSSDSVMLFTSQRKTSRRSKNDENLWISVKTGETWGEAILAKRKVGNDLNNKYHNATLAMSPDETILYTYSCEDDGSIYYSKKRKNGKWKEPKKFKVTKSKSQENSITMSPDGKTIYFSTNHRRGLTNYGGHDIFKCTLDVKNKWSKPINLGPTINSDSDEIDVFMAKDGKTLYFSSNGIKSMGEFDIMKSTLLEDGNWSEPVNLGYPINTPQSERFFKTVGDSGKRGYYASSRNGGEGKFDIYSFINLGPAKPLQMLTENKLMAFETPSSLTEGSVDIKTSRLTIVKGIVRDFENANKFLDATIEITDNATGGIISTLTANAGTGAFVISLPSGKDYGIAIKKEGYLFYSENIVVPQTQKYQEINRTISLMEIKKNAKIVLRNVFFETAKATLDPKSNAELDNLIDIMTSNPNLKIEISGHTDNVGNKVKNQKLSEARAQSVVNYLSKSIPVSRLTYKGYGMAVPVATNKTAEGRQQNRRVEFKILSNE